MPRQNRLVFATPRSGSNLIYSVVSQALRDECGAMVMDEYFNPRGKFWTKNQNGNLYVDAKINVSKFDILPQAVHLLIEQRVEWLKESKAPHSLKLMSTALPKKHLSWFRSHYSWIFVERRDLFEQFLSWAIALQTDKWYGSVNLKKGSLVINPEMADELIAYMEKYEEQKAQFKRPTVIKYEDVLKDFDFAKILKSCRLQLPRKGWSPQLPQKQSTKSKLLYFEKPDHVKRIFEKSGIQRRFPRDF